MILLISFILFCLAGVIQIVFLFIGKRYHDFFSHYIIITATLLLFYTVIERSIKINFVAITNTFESLVFFSGVIGLLLFVYNIIIKKKAFPLMLLGGTIIIIILLVIAFFIITPRAVLPPIPALQSPWLVMHVILAFIGEAFFAVAFVTAIYYLLAKDKEKKAKLDNITYILIAIGYPIFTIGALIFGAIWAQYAWGSFWSWDPKETWALITWLTYTIYLHTRLIKRLRGTISAVFIIIGFLFTLFTFLGVNYLLPGLHSYA